MPRFGPILKESDALASPMAVVALDVPKRLKICVFLCLFFCFFRGPPPRPHGLHVGCTWIHVDATWCDPRGSTWMR